MRRGGNGTEHAGERTGRLEGTSTSHTRYPAEIGAMVECEDSRMSVPVLEKDFKCGLGTWTEDIPNLFPDVAEVATSPSLRSAGTET